MLEQSKTTKEYCISKTVPFPVAPLLHGTKIVANFNIWKDKGLLVKVQGNFNLVHSLPMASAPGKNLENGK